jgi:replicative DNA helicase
MLTQDFEEKVLSLLTSDVAFGKEAILLLEPQDFSSPHLQFVMTIVKKFFDTYRGVPSQSVVINEVAKALQKVRPHKDEVRNISKAVSLVGVKPHSEEVSYIRNEFREFVKSQRMKRAISTSLDQLSKGQVDGIVPTIQDAAKIGIVDDPGREFASDFLDRITERQNLDQDLRVPTLIPPLDHVLRGGLGPGELGVTLGVPKKGKSMLLGNLCFASTVMHKRSAYISLEMGELDIMSRFDSLITGIPFNDLVRNSEQLTGYYEKVKQYAGYLFVKKFPSRSCRVDDIDAYLQVLENGGTPAEMVVVDYGNLIQPKKRSTSNKYYDLDEIFMDLHSLAGERKIPIWTVARANRNAVDALHVTEKYTAESFAVNYACDVMLSLNQTDNERMMNKMRLRIIYVRNNNVGVEIPLITDFHRSKLRYDEVNVGS